MTTEKKPIYYSDKSQKYYFNTTTAFGKYYAQTVYGGEKLKGGKIRIDKNGRQFIMGLVSKTKSKNGFYYYQCVGFVEAAEEVKENETEREV